MVRPHSQCLAQRFLSRRRTHGQSHNGGFPQGLLQTERLLHCVLVNFVDDFVYTFAVESEIGVQRLSGPRVRHVLDQNKNGGHS